MQYIHYGDFVLLFCNDDKTRVLKKMIVIQIESRWSKEYDDADEVNEK